MRIPCRRLLVPMLWACAQAERSERHQQSMERDKNTASFQSVVAREIHSRKVNLSQRDPAEIEARKRDCVDKLKQALIKIKNFKTYLLDRHPNDHRKATLERLAEDIETFESQAHSADLLYLAMFAKHSRYRCLKLEMSCSGLIDDDVPPVSDCWALSGAFTQQHHHGRIFWGQRSVNCKFSNKVDNPTELNNKRIMEVAKDIKNQEIPEDWLKVTIAFHPTSGKWYAINNRGFTTTVLAGVPPLRIFPTPPEDQGGGRFGGANGRFIDNQNPTEPLDRTEIEETCGPEQDPESAATVFDDFATNQNTQLHNYLPITGMGKDADKRVQKGLVGKFTFIKVKLPPAEDVDGRDIW